MEDVKNQLDDIKQENQALEAQVQRKFQYSQMVNDC